MAGQNPDPRQRGGGGGQPPITCEDAAVIKAGNASPALRSQFWQHVSRCQKCSDLYWPMIRGAVASSTNTAGGPSTGDAAPPSALPQASPVRVQNPSVQGTGAEKKGWNPAAGWAEAFRRGAGMKTKE